MSLFPKIESANPCKLYSFGEYQAVLLDEVQAAHMVQYHYVLMVHRGTDKTPCLAVASEYSCPETEKTPFASVSISSRLFM